MYFSKLHSELSCWPQHTRLSRGEMMVFGFGRITDHRMIGGIMWPLHVSKLG